MRHQRLLLDLLFELQPRRARLHPTLLLRPQPVDLGLERRVRGVEHVDARLHPEGLMPVDADLEPLDGPVETLNFIITDRNVSFQLRDGIPLRMQN